MKAKVIAPSFDWERVRSRTDLKSLIESSLGPSVGGRWRCPWVEHGRANLAVYNSASGDKWKCHACGPPRGGDVFDWLEQHEGLGKVDAYRKLAGDERERPRKSLNPPARSTKAKPEGQPAWKDPQWQEEAGRLISEAEDCLWDERLGELARAWLERRGISMTTARRFRLGYMPTARKSKPLDALTIDGKPQPIYCPRGIVIPHVAPDCSYHPPRPGEGEPDQGPRWVGVNVRCLADTSAPKKGGPKYQHFRGSMPGYGYPSPRLDPSQGNPPALIVEGELDALLAEQNVGHLAWCLTIGSARTNPQDVTMASLGYCSHWFICTDRDDAGEFAAYLLADRWFRKARRIYAPEGKDISECFAQRHDFADWFSGILHLE